MERFIASGNCGDIAWLGDRLGDLGELLSADYDLTFLLWFSFRRGKEGRSGREVCYSLCFTFFIKGLRLSACHYVQNLLAFDGGS